MSKYRNTYSPELKLSLIREYEKRNCSSLEFFRIKKIPSSTFFNWLKIYQTNTQGQSLPSLINVTEQMKEVNTALTKERYFTIYIKGIEMKFHIDQLHEVMEEINND